jgi:hypothetical protein
VKQEEIMRRLRALFATPPKERPFSVPVLAHVSGIRESHLWRAAKSHKGMYREQQRRLERAFTLLENGQVEARRVSKARGTYEITVYEDTLPEQTMLTRIRMTDRGPVLDWVAVNKAAFPVLPQVIK